MLRREEEIVEFRRIQNLPPYVFAQVNELKARARRAGEDIVDLGFGNPDIPSAPEVVEKLVEAARNPRNHRYSVSRGVPNLRKAIADRYRRRFGVEIDPDTEAINTIGAKEGIAHLMWTLTQPGDAALVPEPTYPIHLYAPALTGAEVRRVPLSLDADFYEFSKLSLKSKKPTAITAQCSVFAESEVVSLIAKKTLPEDIAAGAQQAVARRVLAMARRVGIRPTFAISGGCAKNEGLLQILEERLDVPVVRLTFDPQLVGALGAALMAQRRKRT